MPKIRRRLRHRKLLRHRPPRHLPSGHRRERAGPPGEVLACTDSHTCAGALQHAARGLGPIEVYSIMCTGTTWYQVAPTVRYELEGVNGRSLRQGHLPAYRRRIRRRRQPEPRIRRPRPGRYPDARSTHDRHPGRGGVSGFQHLRGRRRADRSWTTPASADYTAADRSDATYHDVRHIDLATLEPYVARPDIVSRNGLPGVGAGTQKVDQAFIGSCANGQLEDLEIAAIRVARQDRRSGGAAARHAGLAGGVPQAMRWATCRTSSMRVASSPTRPAAPASATTWVCRARRDVHHVEHPQLHGTDGQHRGRDLSWPHRRPSRRPRSPDISPTQGV